MCVCGIVDFFVHFAAQKEAFAKPCVPTLQEGATSHSAIFVGDFRGRERASPPSIAGTSLNVGYIVHIVLGFSPSLLGGEREEFVLAKDCD